MPQILLFNLSPEYNLSHFFRSTFAQLVAKAGKAIIFWRNTVSKRVPSIEMSAILAACQSALGRSTRSTSRRSMTASGCTSAASVASASSRQKKRNEGTESSASTARPLVRCQRPSQVWPLTHFCLFPFHHPRSGVVKLCFSSTSCCSFFPVK